MAERRGLSISLLFVVLTITSATIVLLFRQNYNYIIANNENNETTKYERNQPVEDKFSWSEEHHIWTILEELNDESPERSLEDIWPSEELKTDRIIEQISLSQIIQESDKIFKIKPPIDQRHYPDGPDIFQDTSGGCLIDKCEITYDKDKADALIFLNSDVIDEPSSDRRKDQVWIAYFLESPINTFDKRFPRAKRGKHIFNWTASYRSDSDIVTPYSKFVPYKSKLTDYIKLKSSSTFKEEHLSNESMSFNISNEKSGKVAWLVSNCHTPNQRLEYAKKLFKYIDVDIYGKCGDLTCPKWNDRDCLAMINQNYKFYLSFENSNCRQYITEKLFKNALGYNDLNHLLVPIVMGPSREEYEVLSPPGSFIHVDDFKSVEYLANYLKLLDRDNELYQSYFRWKNVGRFIDTKFMCRVCAMLHQSHLKKLSKWYPNIQSWWLNYQDVDSCQN